MKEVFLANVQGAANMKQFVEHIKYRLHSVNELNFNY